MRRRGLVVRSDHSPLAIVRGYLAVLVETAAQVLQCALDLVEPVIDALALGLWG